MQYYSKPSAILFAILLAGNLSVLQVNTNHTTNNFKSEKMKEYILLIHLPLNYGPEEAQEVREQWTALTNQWKAEGIFVTSFIFPGESHVVTGKKKIAREEAVVSGNTKLISSIVIKATGFDQAVKLAQMCPVLDQGGTIEIREVQLRPESINKKIIRNLYENILNNRNYDLLDDLISNDYTGARGEKGADGFKETVISIIDGFPDIKWTIENLSAENDKVTVKWHWNGTHTAPFLGIPASGKPVTNNAIVIYQLKDNKIINAWIQGDRLGLLIQIGAIPAELVPAPPQKK